MADRIKGITIELDADTIKLTDALKSVNKEIRSTCFGPNIVTESSPC